jgi:hypothetical protein
MPEATVDEHGDPEFRQHEVRAAWKIRAMQAKAESGAMRSSPRQHFQSSILASDGGHIS